MAECIQYLRGHVLDDSDFVRKGVLTKALVTLRLDDPAGLIDLDDPAALMARRIRPSQVATLRRTVTQGIARSIFHDGATGLSWWSTLDADWTNVTLFHERALPHIVVTAPPRVLSKNVPEVRAAADWLGVAL